MTWKLVDIESKKAVIVSNLSKNLWMITLILFSLFAVVLLKVPAIGIAQAENFSDNSTLINETLPLPDIVNNTINETIINDTQIANETIVNENYTNDFVNNTNPDGVLINDTELPIDKSKFIVSIQSDTSVPLISFTPPTPANGAITTNTSIIANISITNASELNKFIWNWNGTNYTFYNSSLVLMMNFDNVSAIGENSTKVVDISSNSVNGTVYNAVFNATGKYGGAYQFNGFNAWINGTKMATNAVDNWAIAAWIKPAALPQGVGEAKLAVYNGNDGNATVGGYGFGIGDGAGLAGSKLQGLFGTVAWIDGGYTFPAANAWYYVVMTRVSGTTYFYVNGNQTATSALYAPSPVVNVLSIGCQINVSNNPWRYFNGTIDEVRVWNRSLSVDEVKQRYYSNLNKYDIDKWTFITNQSNLTSRGSYTYQGCANNTLGSNCTDTRSLYAGDWTPPSISFTNPTPANSTFTTSTSAVINISITNAPDMNEFKWNWNSTNYTFYNDSLELMFNFDNVTALGENSTRVVDVSRTGNNGTLFNSPARTTGKYDGAWGFAGTTYATTTITGFSASTGTVLMWIKPNKDLRNVTQAFFDTYPSGIGALRIYSNNDNTLRYETGGVSNLAWTIPSNWSGQWHQIGLNWSGSSTALIVDGAVVASGGNTNAPAITTFEIGRYNNGWNFNGTIDEVRVYSAGLSPGELKQQYYSNLNKYDTDKWAFYTNQSNLTTGAYTYQGFAKDTNNNTNKTDLNYLYIDLTAPTTALVSPPLNGNITASNTVNFTCNATDNFKLANITFYWNYTGTWQANGTTSATGIFNQTNFSRTNLNNGAILWNCLACDNASQCSFASANYTVNVMVQSTIPTLTFLLQDPADVSTTNALVRGMNVTYNITSPSGINTSTVFIYYKTNSTSSDTFIYRNGTSISGYQQKTGVNASTNWTFNQQDNEVYPGTYNYDELSLENTLHLAYSLGGDNDYLKIRLFNVSNAKQYSFFEVMAYNLSANSGNLRVYYCNSTYTTENPATASICTNFYSLPASQLYNHTHTAYSSHYVIPFAINTTTGQIGNIRVTGTSYFLLRGATPSSWNVSYISNISRIDAIQTTVDIGGSWTNLSGTADSHLHQFDGTEILYYYVCANNTLGESNCSSARSDLLNLSGLPPTPPNVYNPITGRYRDGIAVNYAASLSPNSYAIIYYNISLVLTNYTFVKTIQTNNSASLSYLWNSTGTSDGEYKIRVQACDNLSQCNYGYSENFTLDNSYPQWSNPAINETIVYWNDTVKFNATWTNAQLAGYIFSIKQNGTYWNSSYILFSGTTNVSENISLIVAPAGTNVNWSFWANDTAGNANQTALQSFVVQSIPTSLTFSVNQTLYPQGRSPSHGYDIYIPFQARYLDNAGNPIADASCNVTNDETLDNVALTYNATTGNYTGQVTDYMMYDVVSFNATCSKVNYVSVQNSTSAQVWFFSYLWEYNNLSYGSQSLYTTHWLRKEPSQGAEVYTLTQQLNTTAGSNLVYRFPFYGSGTNGTFLKNYLFTGDHTLRMNLSVNDSSCKPYLCLVIKDWYLNDLLEQCGTEQAITANTPTVIENNLSLNFTLDHMDYLFQYLYVNCSAPVSANVNIYYNYSGEPVNFEANHAQPYEVASQIIEETQLDSGYYIGPNQTLNSTKRVIIMFNNSASNVIHLEYIYKAEILLGYPNSILAERNYIYNSTGGLWASDNASAGAPNSAVVYSNNQIVWGTEMIPANTAVNETLIHAYKDAIRDEEILIENQTIRKMWVARVYSIYAREGLRGNTYNVTAWTNYSAYGVPANFDFKVNKTNSSGTFDITSQSIINTTAKTIAFPITSLSEINYTVTASDMTPPTVHLISPANGTLTNQASQTFLCNVTNTEIANLALNILNSSGDLINTNTTGLSGTFNSTNWTFTLPYDDSWKWNCLGYDTSGNSNYSSEGNYTVILDRVAPTINVLECNPSQTGINGSVVCNATITDATGIGIVKANITLPNTSVIWASVNNLSSNYYFTFNYTGLEGRYNITWFANDSIGNSNISGGYFVVSSIPSVFIISPHGEVFDQRKYVPILTTASDPDGIDTVISQVTLPDGTKVNITLGTGQQSDNFDTDSMGIKWVGENSTANEGQNCVADINTTTSGAAHTSISGSGAPYTNTYCSILSKKAVAGNFDISVSFNATNFTGSDMAINFVLTEEPTVIVGVNQIFMSMGNWTGTGQEYQSYVIAENFSDFVSRRNTNDTYGKFRVTRVNNTFAFYTWNSSSWFEENMSQHNFSLNKALYITLQSVTSTLNWGRASVNWNNLTINSSNYTFGMFSDTNLTGNYNVTIIANDTLGTLNNTEKTNFTIEFINSPPSVPFVQYPNANSVAAGVKNITWSNVVDKEGDALQFNITLLNTDYSFNSTVASNYGNSSTTSYGWNTTLYRDGDYSLKVTVFENATAERLSSSNTLYGSFTIDNTPPTIQFLYPTWQSGNYSQNDVWVNITANDTHFSQLYIIIYDSTGLYSDASTSNNYYDNALTSNMPDGTYYLNATASDIVGNTNSTETRILVIDTKPPYFTNLANQTLLYGQSLSYIINANDSGSGVNCFSVNNTGNFSINCSGFLKNVTSLSLGIYWLNVSVNDSVGNLNSSIFFVNVSSSDVVPPVITSTFIEPYDPAVGYNITFNATATDNIGVSGIFVNITLPNGTIITKTLPMANYTIQIAGRHNVTFWAIDAGGNIGTATDYFIAGSARVDVQFNVINNNSEGIPVNLTIYFAGTNKEVNEHNFIGTYADVHTTLFYDLYYQALNGNLSVRLNEVNLSLDNNRTMGFDRFTSLAGYLVTYGINSTYSFTNATIVLSYAGTGYTNEDYLGLYKCADWNFVNETCSGAWAAVSGTQDKTMHTFSLLVTSFSGYAIKQESVPPSPPSPGPSGGGGGGGATSLYKFNILITGNCTGRDVILTLSNPKLNATAVSDVQVTVTYGLKALALVTNGDGITKFKPSIAGNYTFEFKKNGYTTEMLNYTIYSCPQIPKPIIEKIPEIYEKVKKPVLITLAIILAIVLIVFIIIKVCKMRKGEREFHHKFNMRHAHVHNGRLIIHRHS